MLGFAPVPADAAPQLSVEYQQFKGLQVSADGIPLIQGSMFQYYEPGWTKGIYSSSWKPKQVEGLPDGRIRVRYRSDDGLALGELMFTPEPGGLKADYTFRWLGDSDVMLENCIGLMWAPSVEHGYVSMGAAIQRNLISRPANDAPMTSREFGPRSRAITFRSPWGAVNVRAERPTIAFDARGYRLQWAQNRELFWLGYADQKIGPNQSLLYTVRWNFETENRNSPPSLTRQMTAEPREDVLIPSTDPLPLIPKPKKRIKSQGALVLGDDFTVEAEDGLEKFAALAEEGIDRHWSGARRGGAPRFGIWRRTLHRPKGAYRIDVTPERIDITANDDEGFRNAAATVPWLTEVWGDRLVIPVQQIEDWPSLEFRGLHMFTGPTALDFQGRMIDRVFAPLKINRAVVQCERTAWESLPGTATDITVSKADLATLFEAYRNAGIEPIPLIQSLGHMEWFFANKQNLMLAVNANVPYTLDVRRKAAQDLLREVWMEADALLDPKIAHFGLDEIAMRGMERENELADRLWQMQVPWLMSLAEEMGAAPMVWGDMMLAAGEAPDATHADSPDQARSRREALSSDTYIADWHYLANPNPARFGSLARWRSWGHRPVASTWWRPDNIRGMALAAIQAGAPGLLQTTWAGYESSEVNMIREYHQFAAYILAADYAWSGRTELPAELPYDPADVLTRLYFAEPEPIQPRAGTLLARGDNGTLDVGRYRLRKGEPLQLHTPIHPHGVTAPQQITVPVKTQAEEIVLLLDCLARVEENDVVGRLEVVTSEGSLKQSLMYGLHLRSGSDTRATYLAPRKDGLSAVAVKIPQGAQVQEVRISSAHPAAGARMHGMAYVSD